MVSMTWKKVTGSVSIPSDERGSNNRNSRASCSLSSRATGSRRVRSISSDAAPTAARTVSARVTTLRSPASSAEIAICLSKSCLAKSCLTKSCFTKSGLLDRGGPQRGPRVEFLVDLLDRLAPGFDAEEVIDRARHQEPAAEINERHWDLCQRHVGLEIVVGADDQRKAHR